MIYKLSDFKNLSLVLDNWFEFIEDTPLCHDAFQRILFEEELNILTANKYLSAMQLIEGYSLKYYTDKNTEKDFFKTRNSIINELTNEDSKNFVLDYCIYKDKSFMRVLKKFTFDALSKLVIVSKSEFNKRNDNLIRRIQEERDLLTHSSTTLSPSFSEIERNNIAYIYKAFYRINILNKIEDSYDALLNRISNDEFLVAYLLRIFEIKIDYSDEISDFDQEMLCFSD